MLSSFATAETNEQTKVKIRVPAEVPRDTGISIEDLVYTDVDESDVEIHQSKENEKKAKQPGTGTQGPLNKQTGNGTQEPKKKTARNRDPITREKEHGQQQADEVLPKQALESTFHAQSSSNLSSQWWTRCTASRRSCARRKDGRDPSGNKELEHDVESDVAEETMPATVKLAKEIDEPVTSANRVRNASFVVFQEKVGYTMRRAPARAGWSRGQMALHTEMCEKSGVTTVEEGHDVERVIVVRKERSAMMFVFILRLLRFCRFVWLVRMIEQVRVIAKLYETAGILKRLKGETSAD